MQRIKLHYLLTQGGVKLPNMVMDVPEFTKVRKQDITPQMAMRRLADSVRIHHNLSRLSMMMRQPFEAAILI